MVISQIKYLLFSYGTLQLEKVLIETYGRLLKGDKNILSSYKIGQLRITDKDVLEKSGKEFHPIAVKSENPDDFIKGTIFEITETEMANTDLYEMSDYIWILATFYSGKKAWIYVGK